MTQQHHVYCVHVEATSFCLRRYNSAAQGLQHTRWYPQGMSMLLTLQQCTCTHVATGNTSSTAMRLVAADGAATDSVPARACTLLGEVLHHAMLCPVAADVVVHDVLTCVCVLLEGGLDQQAAHTQGIRGSHICQQVNISRAYG